MKLPRLFQLTLAKKEIQNLQDKVRRLQRLSLVLFITCIALSFYIQFSG